jgi:hypothetical protein
MASFADGMILYRKLKLSVTNESIYWSTDSNILAECFITPIKKSDGTRKSVMSSKQMGDQSIKVSLGERRKGGNYVGKWYISKVMSRKYHKLSKHFS